MIVVDVDSGGFYLKHHVVEALKCCNLLEESSQALYKPATKSD